MQLIVISGPIASGKTTTGQGVAAWARERGLTAAAIDMDELVAMVMGRTWNGVASVHWHAARQLAAALLDRLGELNVELATLSGPFFVPAERLDLWGALNSSPSIRFVTLQISLEESLRRCVADTTRNTGLGVITRDLDFVRRVYEDIDWRSLPDDDLIVSSDELSVDDVVQTIVATVELP